MNDDPRNRFADYLDGLLDDDETRSIEAEIAADPAAFDEAVRLREILYRPYAVPAPPGDLDRRIRARHTRRPLLGIVRYAAVFAAGVLTTLVVQSSAPVATEAAAPGAAPADPPPLIVNRRIR